MAGYYDDQLKELHQKMLRKQHLDKMLEDLYMQRMQIGQRVDEFKEAEQAANAAIKRLEGTSLQSLFAGIRGNKEAKLTEARQKAQAAKLKIQTMDATMDAIYDESMKCRAELKGMDDCIKEYNRVYEEKKAAIKASDSEQGEKLVELESTISELEELLKEIEEAAAVGKGAREIAGEVREALDNADGYATWDVFGGNMISDTLKYDELDKAQRGIEQLQGQLQAFRAELIDVKFSMDINYAIDGFMRFADWFFDGVLTDWTVKQEIGNALQQVDYAIEQLDKVRKQMYEIQDETKQKLETAKKEVAALVDSVSM